MMRAPAKLRFAEFLAELLDRRFTIPGTSIRFGLDPLIGLVPGIGDALANLLGSAILLIAARYGIPKIVLLRMGINIAINAVIGSVPVFGSIFSVGFRSNVKNVLLLQRYAGMERPRAGPGDWIFVGAIIAVLLLMMSGVIAALIWLLRAVLA